MPMRITLLVLFSPLEAKSLSHTSLQPFRPVCPVASMQYQSVLPNSGTIYHTDIAQYIVYRAFNHHEIVSVNFFLTYLCQRKLCLGNLTMNQQHETKNYGL